MESVWYYVVNGTQTGPVTLAALKEAAAAKKLSPVDLVWQEGTSDWVPASTVAGLFPAAPPAPPPHPTYALASSPPPASTPVAQPTSQTAAPLSLDGPEPLPLDDDEPAKPSKPRKSRREAATRKHFRPPPAHRSG